MYLIHFFLNDVFWYGCIKMISLKTEWALKILKQICIQFSPIKTHTTQPSHLTIVIAPELKVGRPVSPATIPTMRTSKQMRHQRKTALISHSRTKPPQAAQLLSRRRLDRRENSHKKFPPSARITTKSRCFCRAMRSINNLFVIALFMVELSDGYKW